MINIKDWQSALAEAKTDEEVGISLGFLGGDDTLHVYAIAIPPSQSVNAHYHPEGVEIYQILEGKGKIKSGYPRADQTVDWLEAKVVKAGDFLTIPAGTVHQLQNDSGERLILIVTCSPSNLQDNRVVTRKEGDQ